MFKAPAAALDRNQPQLEEAQMHDKRGNRPASSPPLTEDQRLHIERARKFGDIPAGDIPAVMGSDDLAWAYGLALGEARFHIGELLAVIDELTGGEQ